LIRNIPEVNAIQNGHVFHEKFHLQLNQKICLYQGALMRGRGLEMLMDAFDAFSSSDYVLVIMGGGKLASEIQARSQKSDKIYFHPLVAANEIGKYSGSADCGINSVEPLCLSYAYCLPNKFFETVLSEVPILTNDLIDCTALVKEYTIGAVVMNWNIEGIQDAVKEICARPKSEFQEGFKKFRLENSWGLEKEKWKTCFQNQTNEI
jgi:glycosyltransferase involved in cell wall biosynthesis